MREVILLIDDADSVHQMIKAQLGQRFEILSAYDGKAGLIAAAKSKPDLILLDVEMPGMGGDEVCRQLQADRGTRSIPVVFLTAARTVEERVRGLDSGACDYISKPFEPAELRARLRAVRRMRKALNDVTRNTMIDEVTGLFNRRYFDTQMNAGLAAARRTGRPLGCILMGIDQMHVVNDTFGREWGDQVLYAVGQCLSQASRREDVLCRFGGDEFGVLVPDTTSPALAAHAERVCIAVRSVALYDAERVIKVTASVGSSRSTLTDGLSVIPVAEAALYRARQAGGNTVRFGRKLAELRKAA